MLQLTGGGQRHEAEISRREGCGHGGRRKCTSRLNGSLIESACDYGIDLWVPPFLLCYYLNYNPIRSRNIWIRASSVQFASSADDGDIRLIFARAWKPQLMPCILELRDKWSAWNRQLENALIPYGFEWNTLMTWKVDDEVKSEHEYMLWTAISSTVGKDAELTLRSVKNDDKRGHRAYHELARRYDRKSRIIREALEEQWENIKLRNYKDVKELIVKVQATCTRLLDQGVEKKDSDHARILRKAVQGHTKYEKLLNHDILHSDESSPLEDLTHLTNVLINTGTLSAMKSSANSHQNERPETAARYAAESDRSANPSQGKHAPPEGWALVQTNKQHAGETRATWQTNRPLSQAGRNARLHDALRSLRRIRTLGLYLNLLDYRC